MRVPFVIVICIIVILGMVVEVNAIARVHDEYRRRRWVQGQSASVKIHHELPTGVHYEYYMRRRRRIQGRPAVKISHVLPAKENRRQPSPCVRTHLRQRIGCNIYV